MRSEAITRTVAEGSAYTWQCPRGEGAGGLREGRDDTHLAIVASLKLQLPQMHDGCQHTPDALALALFEAQGLQGARGRVRARARVRNL